MTGEPWPCSSCGAPGVRNLGSEGYCAWHLAELYSTFDASVFRLQGIGLPTGERHPEFGPDAAGLTCVACGATWVDAPCTPCPWCERTLAAMQVHQSDLVLTRPEYDPDDEQAPTILAAWARRMQVAVDAGIVDQATAATALRREVARVAA